jgi:hypothetical protein
LSPRHDASSGCGWKNSLHIWRIAANISNKQSQITDKGWSSSWGLGVGLTINRKSKFAAKYYKRPQTLTDSQKGLSSLQLISWLISQFNNLYLILQIGLFKFSK